MPQVDFYILPDDNSLNPDQYACRLIHKIYRLGHRIQVLCKDSAHAQQLDVMLWQHEADSFVPHDCAPAINAATPIVVDWRDTPQLQGEILVNLAGPVPACHTGFQRIAEVVPGNPDARQQSRTNFRHYQKKDYPLKTHQIASARR